MLYSMDTANFINITKTTVPHWEGAIESFQDKLLAIAGRGTPTVERFDNTTWKGIHSVGVEPYFRFSTLSTENYLFLFGTI